MMGKEVATLVNEVKAKAKGEYTLKYNAEGLRSGVYFVKATSNNEVRVGKFVKMNNE